MKNFLRHVAVIAAALTLGFASCKIETDDNSLIYASLIYSGITQTGKNASGNTADTYSITITASEHGTVIANKTTAKEGETITLSVTPANGYKFGTLTEKNGEANVTVTNSTFTMPAANVTVSATFEALPENSWCVTFNTMGGTAVEQQIVANGEKATKPTDPTKTGYTFNGWYNGESSFDFNTKITQNITLTAKWTANTVTPNPDESVNTTTTYSITVTASEHGTVSADKTTAKEGETITLTATPEDGYKLGTLTVKNGEI